MILKIFYFTQLVVHSVSLFVPESLDLTERNCATTEMVSRLVAESKRSTLFCMNLDSEIIDAFLRSHHLQFTVVLREPTSSSKWRKIGASIVHVGRYIEFENFYRLIRPAVFSFDGHFIIIYDGADAQEIEKMFQKLWRVYIYNVVVLTTVNATSPNLVSVFTYMPFADGSCNLTKPIRINEFNKTSTKWTTSVYFPKKFKQLNRCPLHFGCYADSPGVIVNKSAVGLRKYGGINIEISMMFGDLLNFTLKILEYEQGMGVIYGNKSATGMLKRVIDNEVDVIFGSLQVERFTYLDSTRAVYFDKLVLVVTPSLIIDMMRKIFLPFTLDAWISIGMVGLVACCIIKATQFTPKIVHDYVIGSNVKGSMLNVWNVFLGGHQKMLPRRNFPRFLLVKFWILTMIIRNVYQGGVFDILKRDVRFVQLTTVDEFIEHKFTFYVYPSLADRLQGSKLLQRHQLIQNSEIRRYNMMTLNPSFNGVVFNYLKPVWYENLVNRKNFTLKICKEILVYNSFGFQFTKNFYLVDEFNRLIQRFESAGLIAYILSKYQDLSLQKMIEKKNPPSALSYRNIEGFFILYFFGCVLAVVGFICEIVAEHIRNGKKVKTFRRISYR